MAKLKSFIKIEGTLDDLTFYKGKQGYLVKTKSGVSANRIKNAPSFAGLGIEGEGFTKKKQAFQLNREERCISPPPPSKKRKRRDEL